MLFSIILSSVACEEDVTAVLDTGQPYTLFGLITTQLDTQWVRVFPIENRLTSEVQELLDAQVTSTDLQIGESVVWRDSLVLEADGKTSHAFYAPFRAEYGHIYRVEATRSDNIMSYVEVQVPVEADVVVEEPVHAGFILQPVTIVPDVPQLFDVEIKYNVQYKRIFPPDPMNPIAGPDTVLWPEVYYFSYEGKQTRVNEGWRVTFNLTDDYQSILDLIPREHDLPEPPVLYLRNMEVHLIVADEAWDPPGGSLDPEVLIQPGVMSNVKNGFGFIGAGYRIKQDWIPTVEARRAAGFAVLED